MENNTIYPEAATELVEIFKFVEEPILEKIPEKIKEELQKIAKKEHKFEIDKTKKLSEQNLLPETKNLLAGIFIKYCCREEDGNEILIACKENEERIEREKREKYNPDTIFEKRKEIKENDSEEIEEVKGPDCFKLVVIEKLPWYKKITRTIGNLFWKFKNR